jgi:hypothetical protein
MRFWAAGIRATATSMSTRDEISWGYQYVLGRNPQPEEIAHLLDSGAKLNAVTDLIGIRTRMLTSCE